MSGKANPNLGNCTDWSARQFAQKVERFIAVQDSKVSDGWKLSFYLVNQLCKDGACQTFERIVAQIGLTEFEGCDAKTPTRVFRIVNDIAVGFKCCEQVVHG